MMWHVVWAQIPAGETLPLWLKLSPEARVRVALSLVIIVILGLLLLLFIRSFGRWIRHYAGARPEVPARSPARPSADDWSERPLKPREPDDGD